MKNNLGCPYDRVKFRAVYVGSRGLPAVTPSRYHRQLYTDFIMFESQVAGGAET